METKGKAFALGLGLLALGGILMAKAKPAKLTGTAKVSGGKPMAEKMVKSNAEWKKELNAQCFFVMREGGTESPFHNEFWDKHDDGSYVCASCGALLFKSDSKFDSGTGWPSYFQPADPQALHNKTDNNHGMVRTEVTCARCGGHLGHLFDDGPPPTRQRYCINSVALKFEPKVKDEKGK